MSALTLPRRGRRAAGPRRGLTIEPRAVASLGVRVGVLAGSLVGAALVGALLLAITGYDAVAVYQEIYDASFGTPLSFSQTLVQTTPIVLTACAAAIAYRVKLYTIGADGQLLVGAVVASGIALQFDGLPGPLLIVLAMLGGVVGGALWAGIAGVGRAYLRVDEVISTLMLNFLALYLINYLIIDTQSIWRDPTTSQAQGALLPEHVVLPPLFEQADAGILIAVAVALALWAIVRWTRWGYELRVIGDSPRAGRYAGMRIGRKILTVFLISGALAGLAGAIQVTTVTQALDVSGLSPGLGYGYTGIVVAAIARLSFVAILPAGLLMAALLSAGPALELVQVPQSVVLVLQGLVLLLVAAGQFLLSYRVRRVVREEAS
jgi:general nucleoside transport system permease protein